MDEAVILCVEWKKIPRTEQQNKGNSDSYSENLNNMENQKCERKL